MSTPWRAVLCMAGGGRATPSPEAADAGGLITFFAAYAALYLLLLAAHAAAHVRRRSTNYHAAARSPVLCGLELMLNGLVVVLLCCREAAIASGRVLPCPIMAAVSLVSSVVYPSLWVLRALTFTVTFEPGLRAKHMPAIGHKQLAAVVLGLALLPVLGTVFMAVVPGAPRLCFSQR